jgi:hypothetical protein
MPSRGELIVMLVVFAIGAAAIAWLNHAAPMR